MRERVRALLRDVSNAWQIEGLSAVRRVPNRFNREMASIFEKKPLTPGRPTRHRENLASVLIIRTDLSSAESIRVANYQAENSDDEWILLAPECADICEDGIFDILSMLRENPHCDIVYADEDGPRSGGHLSYPIRKPSFNPEMLLAYNYIGFPVMIRRKTFISLHGFRAEFGRVADHDLWLRAWAAGKQFLRLPKILISHKNESVRISTKETLQVVSRFCADYCPNVGAHPGLAEGAVQIRMDFETYPDVTLVIPTRQSPCGDTGRRNEASDKSHLFYFLESLCRSSWPKGRIHVLIADDLEDGSVYQNRQWPFEVERIHTAPIPGEPFSYAKKMNKALKSVKTEAVILLNDDIRVINEDWIEALLTFSLDDDVGAVGARLLFPDGRIQHAGVIGGLFGNVAHAWFGDSADQPTYQDWALVHRNWSMVTGAVLATRLSVLKAIGGFDESFAIEFNDLDLCLRMSILGYRIVYTPHATLYHFEKASRGPDATAGHELARFRYRWRGIIDDDPNYHPALARDGYRVRVG